MTVHSVYSKMRHGASSWESWETGESSSIISLSARNLGVIFDSHLNLESHINTVCRSAYFHLRNIRSVRNMLTDDACSQLIYALITVIHCYTVCLIAVSVNYKE